MNCKHCNFQLFNKDVKYFYCTDDLGLFGHQCIKIKYTCPWCKKEGFNELS